MCLLKNKQTTTTKTNQKQKQHVMPPVSCKLIPTAYTQIGIGRKGEKKKEEKKQMFPQREEYSGGEIFLN